MSKQNPRNRAEAFAYQFEDDVRLLFSLSATGLTKDFKRQLRVLKNRIETCEILMANDAGIKVPIIPALPMPPIKITFVLLGDTTKKELVFELDYGTLTNNAQPIYFCQDKSHYPITLGDIPVDGRYRPKEDIVYVLYKMEF